jgi:hypothetical protein
MTTGIVSQMARLIPNVPFEFRTAASRRSCRSRKTLKRAEGGHEEEAMKKIRPLSSQELSWYKRIAEQFGKPRLRAVAEAMGGFGGGVL